MKAEAQDREHPSCEELVEGEMAKTLEDLRRLWGAYKEGEEDVEDLGSIYEYGLSFDYVAPNTFSDQPQGYFRYQISWGGPSDEFRFYVNPDLSVHLIEYWYMDWYDGASRELTGDDFQLLKEIFGWFEDGGTVASEYEKAMEDVEVEYDEEKEEDDEEKKEDDEDEEDRERYVPDVDIDIE